MTTINDINLADEPAPKTPLLIWAYELKAQRDELMIALKNLVASCEYDLHNPALREAVKVIGKIGAS